MQVEKIIHELINAYQLREIPLPGGMWQHLKSFLVAVVEGCYLHLVRKARFAPSYNTQDHFHNPVIQPKVSLVPRLTNHGLQKKGGRGTALLWKPSICRELESLHSRRC